jgi:hypothetical protein
MLKIVDPEGGKVGQSPQQGEKKDKKGRKS